MFWRFGGYASYSTLDTILDKQDVTVEELLDESDLIQELKQNNSKLVEFLREEPVLHKLLRYVVATRAPDDTAESKDKDGDKTPAVDEEKPSSGISFFGGKGKSRSASKSSSKKDADGETEQEKQEAQRKKYAYVACEVLSSEVWSITEALMEQPDHLRDFWQYLRRPAPLDPLQAGYFTKVNEALLDKKTEEMLALFKSLDDIVPTMLQHVDCPMIMDLLLKIISLEKHEGGQGIVDWLQAQDLIPLLLGYLSADHNSATQTSAGDFLKAIITISANATTQDQAVIGPNELTRQLVSEKCIQTLIADMLRGGNPLTVGVGIIIEVIRKNNSDYDLDSQMGPEPKTSDPIYLGTLLRQFANHVPFFMDLVRAPAARKPDLKAAFGRTIEPLGFDRFKTCELMAELLHCSNMGLLNERGAEEEVCKRDAQREQLRADGRLATPRAPSSPSHGNSHDEFGSSVDSHGFHHAERPSDDEMDEKPEEIRKLEVQNASDEDGFEKVNVPSADELPDEVNFDELNEKIDQTVVGGLPALSKVGTRDPSDPQNQSPTDPAMPKPLSPKKSNLHFDPPPTQAADSPTTAAVTERISSLDVDEDTVMTEFGEDPPMPDDDEPTELEKELAAHPEDKPAPLFVRKEPATKNDDDNAPASTDADSQQDLNQSVATIQGQDAAAASPNGQRAAYETESDGSPVVGDLLKIQFVEHQVVPTILDFFFRFPWNNFLHNVVYDVVQQVFNGTLDRGYNRTLAFDLFTPVKTKDEQPAEALGLASGRDITNRILDGQRASDLSQTQKGMRLGFMGHLTLIAEEVCKFGNRHPPESLDQFIIDSVSREEWVLYVEGTLAETRDRDNAVLGGVRPENAIGARSMGIGGGGGGGFSSNTANALASAGIGSGMSAQDSLALSEGTVGQAFEINSGTMLSGFGEGDDDDEDMDDDGVLRDQERRSQFTDDEQVQLDFITPSNPNDSEVPTIPPPLNIAPSRARVRLAARLAQRKQDELLSTDPDATDLPAVSISHTLSDEPASVTLGDPTATNSPISASGFAHLRKRVHSDNRFSGLFSSSSSSDSDARSSDEDAEVDAEADDFDEDDAGRDHTLLRPDGDYEDLSSAVGGSSSSSVRRRRRLRDERRRRRPSTTEAKSRTPLDDDDDDEDEDNDDDDEDGAEQVMVSRFAGRDATSSSDDQGSGDGSESSDEGLVEIRSRRA